MANERAKVSSKLADGKLDGSRQADALAPAEQGAQQKRQGTASKHGNNMHAENTEACLESGGQARGVRRDQDRDHHQEEQRHRFVAAITERRRSDKRT